MEVTKTSNEIVLRFSDEDVAQLQNLTTRQKPVVYLAGPITGLTYEQATAWRNDLRETLSGLFEVLSPMRDKTELGREVVLDGEYPDYLLCSAKMIITRDRNDVKRSDALIVHIPDNHKLSLGTPVEIGWANAWEKPTIIVVSEDNPYRKHPFLIGLPVVLVRNFDEATHAVLSLFNF